jgi:chromosome partitioning protein
MNVIVFASRKGGSGKSTLTVHLAAQAHRPNRPILLVDADPQGSLTLWHRLRSSSGPDLRNGVAGVSDILVAAKGAGVKWAFIDTPPNVSGVVVEAIRAATLVIVPARLTVFDLAAVRETIEVARAVGTPFAVVVNGAPALRDNSESPFVTEMRAAIGRLEVPIWGGQITHRAVYAAALEHGQGVNECEARSPAAEEISRLWSAIEKSIMAIHGLHDGAAMHHSRAA